MLESLVLVFGVYSIISGVFLLFGGFSLTNSDDKIFSILEGVMLMCLGLLFIFLPAISIMIAILYISFYAVISGIFQLYYSVKMRTQIKNEWLGILNAVISILFGFVLLMDVIAGAEVIIMLLGFYSIFFGFLTILMSLKLKNHKTV
jgi:uncharacterized membrane protein HdeD (DUF308 family)